jgi:hypothetical protein
METQDLTDNVEVVDCLNQLQPADKVKEMLKGAGRVESDDDEQLFFHFSFRNPCKIKSIVFVSPNDGSRPNTIKLYSNAQSVSFGMVSQEAATQEVVIDWAPDAQGDQMRGTAALKFVRFQEVAKLGLFVEDNVGGEDVTVIEGLTIMGQLINTEGAKHQISMKGHADESHSLGKTAK